MDGSLVGKRPESIGTLPTVAFMGTRDRDFEVPATVHAPEHADRMERDRGEADFAFGVLPHQGPATERAVGRPRSLPWSVSHSRP